MKKLFSKLCKFYSIVYILINLTLFPLNASTVERDSKETKPFLLSLNAGIKQDSLILKKPEITSNFHSTVLVREATVPILFFATSALTWANRENVRKMRNRYVPDFANRLDDYMQYAPAAAVYGLNLAGVKGRNNLARTTVNWATSMIIMGTLINTIKYSAKVQRPDGSSRNSFPSGHTASAFMNATFLHYEYGHLNPAYSIIGYTMSSFTGIERVLNNRHWISDVFMGAGIGILSTRLAYLITDQFYENRGALFSDFSKLNELNSFSYISTRVGHGFNINESKFNSLGIETSFEGAYFPWKKWGIGGELTFGSHSQVIQGKTKREIQSLFSDLGVNDAKVTIQPVSSISFLVGPQYVQKLNSKFIFHAKAMTGLMTSPAGIGQLNGVIEHEGIKRPLHYSRVEYTPYTTWIKGFGISLTMMATPRIGLNIFTDYKNGNPIFKINFPDKFNIISSSSNSFNLSAKRKINSISYGLRLVAFI